MKLLIFLDEIFDTAFEVSVTIKGLEDSKLIPLQEYTSAKNRTRHLKCKGNNCEDFTILHMAWLEYSVSFCSLIILCSMVREVKVGGDGDL